MELRNLNPEELRAVYREHIKRDFPLAERKPLRVMERLRAEGLYDVLGFYEGGSLAAYAMLWHDEHRDYVLLDYLAVCAGGRGRGTGTAVLALLERHYREYAGILAECEAPAQSAAPEENALRVRRLDFYRRAGFRMLGYRVRLFGVEYEMLASGAAEAGGAIRAHRRLYHRQAAVFRRLIEIPYEKS